MSSTSPARTVMRRRRSKDVERQVDDLVSFATQSSSKKQRKNGREEQRQGEPEATPTEQTSVVEEASGCEESKQSDSLSNKTLELVDVARVLHGLTAMVAGLQPSMADSQDEVRDIRSGERQTDDAGGGASQSVAVMTGDKTNDGESVATVAAALQQLTGAMTNLQMPQSGSQRAERREQPRVMTSYMDQKKPRYMKGDASNLPMLRQHHPVTTTEVESEEKCNESEAMSITGSMENAEMIDADSERRCGEDGG
ncbi:hypothetical protein GN244_ATG17990 [Phytophthora infestans]|uniref:Uncharacterized protein n=1 Tax=Phytophthora infestans TaxID=4787 RepID=A0A833RQ26_PHYIN|nr:hypothetical protein GN244_ATG17990 [Phytophthora infestans]